MGMSSSEIGGIVFVCLCFICVVTGGLIFLYQDRERKRMQQGIHYSSSKNDRKREKEPLLKSVTSTSQL